MKPTDCFRIALVLPTEFSFARDVMRGIISATRERNMYQVGQNGAKNVGQRPWIFHLFTDAEFHSSKSLSKGFDDWSPDGFICQIYSEQVANVFRESGKPVVELFESRAQSEFARIIPDDVAAGEMAAKHFLDRGFRNFAYSGISSMRWSKEREQGFKDIIAQAFNSAPRTNTGQFTYNNFDLHGDARWRRASPEMFHYRTVDVAQWLKSLPKPVALFACNDACGSELIQAARECGLNVPQDIAILGVDNDEMLCEICHPPLSSIRIGTTRIGHLAVDVLQRLLEGQNIPKEISRVPPLEVITRQSSDVLAIEDQDVADAVRFIHKHALEGISVKQMLDSVSVNRRTLERRFAKVLGHTPHEEIRRVRIERAKVLLQTDLPIYQVSAKSGFGTPEYLATAFLQATGYNPTDYRHKFGFRSGWEALQLPKAGWLHRIDYAGLITLGYLQ